MPYRHLLAAACILLLVACKKDRAGGCADEPAPQDTVLRVDFGATTLDITRADSVIADFHGPAGRYRRVRLSRQGASYSASLRGLGLSGAQAIILLYRRPV